MEFDEYEYLEKTVENSKPVKDEAIGDRDEKDRSRSSKRKSDEDEQVSRSRSKRSRPEDESSGKSDRRIFSRDGESKRHDERSVRRSSGYHDSPDRRDSDRGEKGRHQSGREQHERRDGHGGLEERKRKERGNGDRERETERERFLRSSRRSDRHHIDRDTSSEQERDKGISKDREFKEREGEREKERELRDKDRRQAKVKKDDVEPEADPERDQRTVFAYQISLKADERDVYEFFSRAGKVRDVRLIMDRISRRSKGVGYVEFYDAMSVPMAIALSGQLLLGQPVMVKPSEAEKNLVQTNAAAGGAGGSIGPYSGGARRLYVGNLHVNMTEVLLRQVFESFGTLELVQLPLDLETGHCRGFGFVQFARLEDARAALTLNGLSIGERNIKVSAISEQPGMQDIGANAGDFDDEDGGGLALDARSRAILMQKLDRTGATTSIASTLSVSMDNGQSLNVPNAPLPGVAPLIHSLGQNAKPALVGLPSTGLVAASMPLATVDPTGSPSDCLLLTNMFDPTNETEPDFDLDIKEDVQDECSKFGAVKHIFVDKNSAGCVYLRFDSATSAASAQKALHGRWFAGKMITATFMIPQNYEAKFPDSKEK